MSVKPIFIFSLPRAGSTLLQRLLSVHKSIDTTAEPWLALPIFFALKERGLTAVYGHSASSAALNGYIDSLPGGKADYYSSASRFLCDLYDCGSSGSAIYFLDKTPRYHLVVDEIMMAFPDAKFIFLWRNPLAIASSMIKTWCNNKWNLYIFYIDLYSGINSLVNASRNSKNKIDVKYEDLIRSPECEMQRIMEYLELEYDSGFMDKFKDAKTIDAPGRGDPTGQYEYSGISSNSTKSWKNVMSHVYRKRWARQYLNWIGEDRLDAMGYDLDELQTEIRDCPTHYKNLFSDVIRNFYGKIANRYCLEEIRNNKPWEGITYFKKN